MLSRLHAIHIYVYIYICVCIYTRWLKYDRDWLCINKSQFVPVIFEPPCIYGNWLHYFEIKHVLGVAPWRWWRTAGTCSSEKCIYFPMLCVWKWLVFNNKKHVTLHGMNNSKNNLPKYLACLNEISNFSLQHILHPASQMAFLKCSQNTRINQQATNKFFTLNLKV
jgi:hypothetical protein